MRQPRPALLSTLTLAVALLVTALPATPAGAADRVVGSGTPASCSRNALAAAVATSGTISFNCGAAPVSIAISVPLAISAPSVTIDGGGMVTLQGAGGRIIDHFTFGTIGSSLLTLRNLTIAGGRASGSGASTEEADKANGGAIRSTFAAADPAFRPTLIVEQVTFRDNASTLSAAPGGRDAYDYGGGAIYAQGGAVIVRDSTFVDNAANNGAGGAIHILQSSLTIERSSFTNNSAIGARPEDSLGGAISVDGLGGPDGLLRVASSSFTNNRAYNSGGAIHVNMYENSSRSEISDSAFVGNMVIGGTRGQGGAIGGGGSELAGRADTGNPTITIARSLFQGNSVRRTAGAGGNPNTDGAGGALAFPQRARLSIASSTFADNQAIGASFNANGGALYVVNNSDQFTISASTFAGNYAGWVGGAISNSQIGGQPGGRVSGTIFASNTAGNGPNDWNIQQHCSAELAHDGASLQHPPRLTDGNFFNDVTCFQGKSAPAQKTDPQFRDPQLGPLADNGGPTQTMAIGRTSPAFDALASCPAVDQRGVSRPRGVRCDLGAFEVITALEPSPGLLATGSTQRTITLRGDGFSAASKAQVGGAERPTSFVNGSTLRVTLSAADVAVAGQLSLSINGPGAGTTPTTISVADQLYRLHLPLLRH